MEEKIFNAALAGLLHDIGKFALSAGIRMSGQWDDQARKNFGYPHALASYDFIQKYVPKIWLTSLSASAYHHSPKDEAGKLVQAADLLSAVERHQGDSSQDDGAESHLVPIMTRVSLGGTVSLPDYRFNLAKLDLEKSDLYPVKIDVDEKVGKKQYEVLWNDMLAELDAWKTALGPPWEKQDINVYFTTLLAVFRKYTWCIPATVPSQTEPAQHGWPDVSLYDHLRLVSAIAACLQASGISGSDAQTGQQPVALLLRGDLSGIQNFIYRIARPESDTEHVAKRLRGRSFYLSLLMETVADYILREFGLPSSCALFIGGGRFDLLLPVNAVAKLDELTARLEQWLIDEFYGELSLPMTFCQLKAEDLKDMRSTYRRLDSQMEGRKSQKWSRFLDDPSFFAPMQQGWHVCTVCQLTPLPEPGICKHCQQQEHIGKHLPHTAALAYFYGEKTTAFPTDQVIIFQGSPFQVKVAMMLEDDIQSEKNQPDAIFQINRTENFIRPGISSSFRFLANEAPLATCVLRGGGEYSVEEGEVLHFDALAELSTGAKRLGVLKADVDRLGFIMGDGLSEDENPSGLRPTLSRIASLSSSLDLFFAGCLNQICREVFQTWKQTSNHPWLEENAVTGAFYIIYSGGDDLFIVGPWDAVLLLAQRLYEEFQRFSGYNPSLTISAGFVEVKPRYPVQKFAELVDEAEKAAKDFDNGKRNHFCLFGEVVDWQIGPGNLKSLVALADELRQGIEDHTFPRGVLADLGQVYRQHFRTSHKTVNPMWTPRLFYALSRRLSPEVFQQLGSKIMEFMKDRKILVPVSITSLKTRKE
jgi:CRISPR-associated protein Csm1